MDAYFQHPPRHWIEAPRATHQINVLRESQRGVLLQLVMAVLTHDERRTFNLRNKLARMDRQLEGICRVFPVTLPRV